jgi:uncharacterized protein YeaO (DUF488 family)
MIQLKRAYEKASRDDGVRILVERLWPRGLTKRKAALELWLKDVAPSPELRKWFGHDPAKWKQFEQRYWKELNARKEAVDFLRRKINQGTVTLVYAAHDEEHNGALALKKFLEHRKKLSAAMTDFRDQQRGAPRNRDPSRSKPSTRLPGKERVKRVMPGYVDPLSPRASNQSALDRIDEASMASFPCSDPPGYGHA